MTAKAERPLPCPFCGAEIVRVGSTWAHRQDDHCHASMTRLRDADIAAWNRRAPDAQVRALTEERDRLRAAISADRAPFLALRVERRINEELGGDATAGWIAEMTLEEIRRNLDEPAVAALGAP